MAQKTQTKEALPTESTIDLLLAGIRNPNTKKAYLADLRYFFDGDLDARRVDRWLGSDEAAINRRLIEFKGSMIANSLSEATVNRRLAAVRALLGLAKTLGLSSTNGADAVKNERVLPYRDTTGFDKDSLGKIIALVDKDTVKGLRDLAVMQLLWQNALRRSEVSRLMVADFDAKAGCIWIYGKGTGTQQVAVKLSAGCVLAIQAYLDKSGHGKFKDSPLFLNLHHGNKGAEALRPDGVHFIVSQYGNQLGIKARPHREFRNGSITRVLTLTNGNLVMAQEHARHKDANTTLRYNKNRGAGAAAATDLLAGEFKQ